jgi:signal transduction histidine kinase
VTTVLQQVRLLRRIASEFSNFAGEAAPRLETASLGEVVAGVIAPYELGLAQRIRFAAEIPADMPAVRVDRTLLARALTNLVENAIQAMPSGGRVLVNAVAAGGRARVTIADTGVGMDADALRHAFEPYFSTKTAGSGLGLANAKRYIELCGGTIAIDSAPGAGVTAAITLPLAEGDRSGAIGDA